MLSKEQMYEGIVGLLQCKEHGGTMKHQAQAQGYIKKFAVFFLHYVSLVNCIAKVKQSMNGKTFDERFLPKQKLYPSKIAKNGGVCQLGLCCNL